MTKDGRLNLLRAWMRGDPEQVRASESLIHPSSLIPYPSSLTVMFAKRLIGIDIGSQDIKLVEILKSGGGVRLLSAERVRLPGNGADLTAKMESAEEAIRSFLATRRRVPVVCSVPPQDATEKVVDLPPTDPDTVDDVMRFEAETHIPLPLDTVNFDHAVVRADPQGTSVLLAACPRHVLGALQNALLKAGAKRFALETPCVALLNALYLSAARP